MFASIWPAGVRDDGMWRNDAMLLEDLRGFQACRKTIGRLDLDAVEQLHLTFFVVQQPTPRFQSRHDAGLLFEIAVDVLEPHGTGLREVDGGFLRAHVVFTAILGDAEVREVPHLEVVGGHFDLADRQLARSDRQRAAQQDAVGCERQNDRAGEHDLEKPNEPSVATCSPERLQLRSRSRCDSSTRSVGAATRRPAGHAITAIGHGHALRTSPRCRPSPIQKPGQKSELQTLRPRRRVMNKAARGTVDNIRAVSGVGSRDLRNLRQWAKMSVSSNPPRSSSAQVGRTRNRPPPPPAGRRGRAYGPASP